MNANKWIKKFSIFACGADQEALYQAQRMVTQAIFKPLEEQITRYQEYQEAQLLSHLISAGKCSVSWVFFFLYIYKENRSMAKTNKN